MNRTRRGPPPAEFANLIGDSQVRGTPNIKGVIPAPVDAQVGIAPPSPLQVQSVFDTRPIAGYDFAFDGRGVFGDEAPPFIVQAQVPNGYTAVLRRLEFEFTPEIVFAVGSTEMGGLSMFITRDDATIPNNVVRFRGTLRDYTWHTHQVFGPLSLMGVRLTAAFDGVSPADAQATVRFFGVLIPSRSLPPTEEVGSDPVLIRDFVKMTRGEE